MIAQELIQARRGVALFGGIASNISSLLYIIPID
jgi:hypothetical protein